MADAYRPFLGTLGYVFSPDRARVLMLRRDARPHDVHFGKHIGLGGKLEPHESAAECMRREVFEESGLVVTKMHLAGTLNWPGFGKNGEDWAGFIFRIEAFTGEACAANPEGSLHWVEIGKVLDLEIWDGDRHFLPLILDPRRPTFHGVMPYKDGVPLLWRVEVDYPDL